MVKAAVKPIPDGMHSLTPHLICAGAAEAIEFYKKAFNAVEGARLPGPGGKLMHAVIRIGDSALMLVDENPQWGSKSPKALGGSPVSLHLYVDDADSLFQRAVAAGCTVTMPIMDAFWGDRYGKVKDPFGHEWGIGTHKEDLTPEEMGKRAKAAFAAMAAK